MEVAKNYYNEIFDFNGQWNIPSKCGLKVISHSNGKYTVIVTELYRDNPGTSVTYAGINLAKQICQAKNIDINSVTYIECNPDMNSKLSFYDEEYFQVSFTGDTPSYRQLSKEEIIEMFK
jgi:hypothetical protein